MCDYYPFGMLVPNRHGNSSSYRYGFQGQEKDDEIKGEGNSYDFGARMLDPRVGRWFAVDNAKDEFPGMTLYNFVLNNPLRLVDPDGNKPLDWYLNLKNGNFEWHNGSGFKKGYDNQGKTTDIASGTGENVRLNSNGTATDLNSGKFYGEGRSIVINRSDYTKVITKKVTAKKIDELPKNATLKEVNIGY